MDLFDAIDTRASAGRLTGPGPSPEQMDRLLRAAGRAPDHGRLRPWRFIVLDGADRERFARAAAAAKRVRIPTLTEEQMARADAMVIHRDRAAIVLNKEPGLATQGGSGTREHVDLLLDAFTVPLPGSEKTVPRPRLVHRLDKDTSGVLLVAATPGSAAFFSKRFAGRCRLDGRAWAPPSFCRGSDSPDAAAPYPDANIATARPLRAVR